MPIVSICCPGFKANFTELIEAYDDGSSNYLQLLDLAESYGNHWVLEKKLKEVGIYAEPLSKPYLEADNPKAPVRPPLSPGKWDPFNWRKPIEMSVRIATIFQLHGLQNALDIGLVSRSWWKLTRRSLKNGDVC